jgi:hypothetical protein
MSGRGKTIFFAGATAGAGSLDGPALGPAGTALVSFWDPLNAPATVLTAVLISLVPKELNPLGVGLELPARIKISSIR